jgi:protein-arginine kinase activator protein McsA
MKCEICSENDVSGVIHLDGKELYVCKACAKRAAGSREKPAKNHDCADGKKPNREFKGQIRIHGNEPPPPKVVDALLKATMEFVEGISKIKEEEPSLSGAPDVCRCCNTPWSEIEERHFLGCPECYRTFAARLRAEKLRWQYGLYHVGNSPEGFKADNELDTLKRKLAAAVKREHFELAAKLRRQIDELERTSKRNG